jgi:hypothetical protein
MGFFDILLGVAILDSLSNKKKKQSSNDGFGSYNRGYNDGFLFVLIRKAETR